MTNEQIENLMAFLKNKHNPTVSEKDREADRKFSTNLDERRFTPPNPGIVYYATIALFEIARRLPERPDSNA
jgi:hypothetical protein